MRYMRYCCCGCRLRTGVLILGAIAILQGLFDLLFGLLGEGGPTDPLSTFRLIWSVTYITAGVIGWAGAWQARVLLVGRFSRFLLLSILVEVVLTILVLSTSLVHCREMIEHHERADGSHSSTSNLDEMDTRCQAVLKTMSSIEIVFKLALGLYFYCVVRSYEHALLQFGTDAIMHASYPVPKQFLPQEAVAQPNGAGAGAAFSAALAAADSAAPRHATIVVREAEEMPVVQATCVS